MQSEEQNEKLNKLLCEWKVEIPLPPRFQEQVWWRIERGETDSKVNLWHALARWVESRFNRPALAVSYVAVLLLVGLTTGYLRAHDKSSRSEARWRTAYVQSVDPYQVPRN